MKARDEAMTACRDTAPRAAVTGPARRRGSKLTLLSFLLTLGAIAGCGSSGGTASEARQLRADVEWHLVNIQPTGQTAVTVPDPTRYTVRFGPDGSVSARVDCNRCAGRYRVDGPALTINPVLACTRAACALPSLESQFTEALTSVSTYIQRESELELVYAGGTLRFRAAP